MERTSEPTELEIVKELLGAGDAMLEIRCHMRLMGEVAGIPVGSLYYVYICTIHVDILNYITCTFLFSLYINLV